MILHKKKKIPPECVNTIIEVAGVPATSKSEMVQALGYIFGFPVLEFPNLNVTSFSGRAILAALKDPKKMVETPIGLRWWACMSMANFLEKQMELTKNRPVFVTNYYFGFRALFGEESTGLFRGLPTSSKCYLLREITNLEPDSIVLPTRTIEGYRSRLNLNPDNRIVRVKPKGKGYGITKYKNRMLEEICNDLTKAYNYKRVKEFEFQ